MEFLWKKKASDEVKLKYSVVIRTSNQVMGSMELTDLTNSAAASVCHARTIISKSHTFQRALNTSI